MIVIFMRPPTPLIKVKQLPPNRFFVVLSIAERAISAAVLVLAAVAVIIVVIVMAAAFVLVKLLAAALNDFVELAAIEPNAPTLGTVINFYALAF